MSKPPRTRDAAGGYFALVNLLSLTLISKNYDYCDANAKTTKENQV